MTSIKVTNNIFLYRNNEDDLMIALKVHNTSELVKNKSCSTCGEVKDYFYLPPELCHLVLCPHCFLDYTKKAKWYIKDISQTLNSLISYICFYDITLEEDELDLINLYLNDHSHREKLDIHKFMEMR